MALFKRNNDEIEALVAVENTVKTRMKEIEKTTDAGERLLQYKELCDKVDAGIDYSKTHKYMHQYSSKESNFPFNGMLSGGIAGGILGIGGAIPTAIIITGPLFGVGLAIAGGIALVAAAAVLGVSVGNTIGKFFFNRLPAEDKHANRMLSLKEKLNDLINKATERNYMNFQAIANSSATEKVKKAFPEFATDFVKAVALDEKRKVILQTNAAETPAQEAATAAPQTEIKQRRKLLAR